MRQASYALFLTLALVAVCAIAGTPIASFAAAPGQPTLMTPQNGATNQYRNMLFVWHRVSGAGSYGIQVSTDSTFASTFVAAFPVTDTTRQVNSLAAMTTYYWRVLGHNDSGYGAWSTIWHFTTGTSTGSSGGTSGGGGGSSSSSQTLSTPVLSWPWNTATNQTLAPRFSWYPVTNASGYNVQVATDTGFVTKVVNTQVFYTNTLTAQLAGNTTFYWRVQAIGSGTSSWSQVWNFTTATVSAITGSAVIATHPRILLDSATKAILTAKKNANDAGWVALKAEADAYKNCPVHTFNYGLRNVWYSNTIFFSYEGDQWRAAAFSLAMAYQMTHDSAYAKKCLQLVDTMISAQNNPANQPPNGTSPAQCNYGYASRNVFPCIAIIYDWCYDFLTTARKTQMVGLMNTYFDSVRHAKTNTFYQVSGPGSGNYFGGTLQGVGYMGYATAGDNSMAQTMIDWARQRFDGSWSQNLGIADRTGSSRKDAFDGWFNSWFGGIYAAPPNLIGAPLKGGFDFQGWSYGTEEFARQIDYMNTIKSATGEDVVSANASWIHDMYHCLRNAVLPWTVLTDPIGDYGGNQGAVTMPNVAARLAFTLKGTSDGPGAQYFAWTDLPQDHTWGHYASGVIAYDLEKWEKFYLQDNSRTSTQQTITPYWSGQTVKYPAGGYGNGATPYFTMRSDWTSNATWIGTHMGAAIFDDHSHFQAGHISMYRNRDNLLLSTLNWRSDATNLGVTGTSLGYNTFSAAANTLFINDRGTYQSTNTGMMTVGGQNYFGKNELIASEMLDSLTYIRSDLSSAYNNIAGGGLSDTLNRVVQKFYRNFLYLRTPNILAVYDYVKAKHAASGAEFDKHIRWHSSSQPAVTGKNVKITKGNSSLYIHTVLPANSTITTVDESSNNSDNIYGAGYASSFNLGTWRTEVRDSLNPLKETYLSILQPGTANQTEMATSYVRTDDSTMEGARIGASGAINYVLFNKDTIALQHVITGTSFTMQQNETATFTLGGMYPTGVYAVAMDANNKITIAQSSAGSIVADSAGVLTFNVSAQASKQAGAIPAEHPGFELSTYPNPFRGTTTIRFTLEDVVPTTLAIYDATGSRVATLVEGSLTAGEHQIEWNAEAMPNGTYYVKLKTGSAEAVRSIVLSR